MSGGSDDATPVAGIRFESSGCNLFGTSAGSILNIYTCSVSSIDFSCLLASHEISEGVLHTHQHASVIASSCSCRVENATLCYVIVLIRLTGLYATF